MPQFLAAYRRLHRSDDSRATLNEGSTHTAKVVHPRGTGDCSLTNADIRDKYAKLTHRAIPAERQDAIEKAVLGIEALDDVAQLTALLTPAVHSRLDRGPDRVRYPEPPGSRPPRRLLTRKVHKCRQLSIQPRPWS